MAEKTIFDRILDGELPCHRVYEDDHVLAFLDIQPIAFGHTLVIPKQRVAYLHELSAASSAAIGRVLPALCRAVMRAAGCTHYNVLQNNGRPAHQAIFHVHFHIIPRFEGSGLGVGWNSSELPQDAVAKLLPALRASLADEPELQASRVE